MLSLRKFLPSGLAPAPADVATRFAVCVAAALRNQRAALHQRPTEIGGGVVNGFDPAVKENGKALTSGYIPLRSEGHETEFRRVELLNLMGCMNPNALDFKRYYVKADPSACPVR